MVRPSSAVREYMTGSGDVTAAGRKLRVDYVLTGSYSKTPERVRLDLEFVDVRSSGRIWHESVLVASKEMFKVRDIVLEKVMRALELELPKRQRKTKTQRKDVPFRPAERGRRRPR